VPITGIIMEKTAAGIPKNEAAAGEVNADPILRWFPLLVPESCMKINEKLGLNLMDENHFISLLFTRWASRRLPSAVLLRACNSLLWLRP
jgi:hypothetical protein